jgi:myo-inositol-1(or 4)-monophosphatase
MVPAPYVASGPGATLTIDPRDLDSFVAGAEAAADAAGAVIRPFFRALPSVMLKQDATPVTIADRQAEEAMRDALARRFPDHQVIGEEYGASGTDARFKWVLDPIDGTRAFVTGRPMFGTLIALMDDDRPVLGIIDQPVTGERWTGVVGRRTVFRGQFGGEVGARHCALSDAELSCTSPEMFGDYLGPFRRLSAAVKRTTFGGDCYAYGLLALGQIDIVLEADLKLWDWAALLPVVEGAGGRITDWAGAPLRVGGSGRVLAVGDPSLIPAALDVIAGPDARS